MSIETKLRAGLVFSILTSLWLTVMWNNSIITMKEQKNKIDKKFKPGLFNQTKKFLEGENSLFCSLSEQVENIKIYYKKIIRHTKKIWKSKS